MKRRVNRLVGFSVQAKDGRIGHVKEFYFDDHRWKIRYMVVDTGSWLHGRQVLISTVALERPAWPARIFPVNLTCEQVRNSPDIDTDKPVSRQHEAALHDSYRWPVYWAFGLEGYAPMVKPSDSHLRSTEQVTGYQIHASGGVIGHVKDFVIDDETWDIRYVVVDMHRWLKNRETLIHPNWIREVDWSKSEVTVELSRAAIESSPVFDASQPVGRPYEQQLFNHYQKPKYWEVEFPQTKNLSGQFNEKDATGRIHNLILELGSESAEARDYARHCLVSLGHAAVQPLLEALVHSNECGRGQAAKALGDIGELAVAPALVKALEDEKFDVRWLAARALAALGRDALPALLQALTERPQSSWLREGAHHVLRDEGYEVWNQQLRPVMRALEGYDPSDTLPQAAKVVLKTFTEQSLTHKSGNQPKRK